MAQGILSGIILIFLTFSCEKDTNLLNNQSVSGKLGDTITLTIGELAFYQVPGAYIRFDTITEDSRCPLNLECIWAGRVTARFTVQNKSGDTEQIEITQPGSDTLKDLFDGMILKLIEVFPYPVYPERITPEDYRIQIILLNSEIQYINLNNFPN